MIQITPPPLRGILIFLTALFLASGAIRTGVGLPVALALNPPETLTPPLAPQSDNCSFHTTELLQAFQNREEQLSTRELAAEERRKALETAEQLIRLRLTELAASEAALAETLARADGAAENDLTRLTSVYEAMKPKDAAVLFETMDPEFAAGFLGRLKAESAAGILSGMTADKAYAISVLLAARNTSVPKK